MCDHTVNHKKTILLNARCVGAQKRQVWSKSR